MASAANPMHVFPLSPPSSGNDSPSSSPRQFPLSHPVAASNTPSFRQSRSLASSRQLLLPNASDSEGYTTETSPSNPTRHKLSMARPLPLPSKSVLRTSNVSSSDSSSSSSTPNDSKEIHPHQTTPNSAIGRKVAVSLELFKETTQAATEEPALPECSSRVEPVCARRIDSVEHVPETFEFVKRSEWADRERDRSLTILDKSQRNSVAEYGLEYRWSCKESPLQDVAQWRRDVALARGRRRERTKDDIDETTMSTIHKLHDRYVPSTPCGYPLSPSPSRSPASRVPVSHHNLLQDLPPVPSTTPDIFSTSPVRAIRHLQDCHLPPPLSPHDTASPWSTDDESNWETASATPTVASNSPLREFARDEHDLPFSLYSDLEPRDIHTFQPLENDGDILNHAPLKRLDDETFAPDMDLPEERLPHIPLRPFRNKVGGHSAIYKFTKQAVCKVSIIHLPINLFAELFLFFSLSFREKTCFTSPWNVKRRLFSDLYHVISVLCLSVIDAFQRPNAT